MLEKSKQRRIADEGRSESRGDRVIKNRREKVIEKIMSSDIPLDQDQKGIPMAIMIQDHTRIGLKINVFKEGRCVYVSISLPQRDSNIERIPLNSIKVKEIIQ